VARRGNAAEDNFVPRSTEHDDSSKFAVIVLVGTTPEDEEAIALALQREGLEVSAEANADTADDNVQGEIADDSQSPAFANRLLRILHRQRQGSQHLTALTIGKPDMERRSFSTKNRVLSYGELTIDPVRREVRVAGEEVRLSKSEFGLLHSLAVEGSLLPGHRTLDRRPHIGPAAQAWIGGRPYRNGARRRISLCRNATASGQMKRNHSGL
jgi:hypothetical protein